MLPPSRLGSTPMAKHCIVLRSCRVFVPIGKTSGRRARCQTGTSTRSHDRVEILGRRIERSTLVGDIMIARFSLYDFIAVVMPGIFFLWAISTFLGEHLPSSVGPAAGDLAETSVIIVVGYVVGLLLQGLSHKFTEGALLRVWGGFPSARWLLP